MTVLDIMRQIRNMLNVFVAFRTVKTPVGDLFMVLVVIV